MKKTACFLIFLMTVLLLTGCCDHKTLSAATCEAGPRCDSCGVITGDALGHDWADAACATAKTCRRCGAVTGTPLGHTWQDPTCQEPMICARCGERTGQPRDHRVESWSLSGEQETGPCADCGEPVTRPADWESIAREKIAGEWTCFMASTASGSTEVEGVRAVFSPEGTAVLYTQGETGGRWNFEGREDDGEDAWLSYTLTLEDDNFSLILFEDNWNFLYLYKDSIVLIFTNLQLD